MLAFYGDKQLLFETGGVISENDIRDMKASAIADYTDVIKIRETVPWIADVKISFPEFAKSVNVPVSADNYEEMGQNIPVITKEVSEHFKAIETQKYNNMPEQFRNEVASRQFLAQTLASEKDMPSEELIYKISNSNFSLEDPTIKNFVRYYETKQNKDNLDYDDIEEYSKWDTFYNNINKIQFTEHSPERQAVEEQILWTAAANIGLDPLKDKEKIEHLKYGISNTLARAQHLMEASDYVVNDLSFRINNLIDRYNSPSTPFEERESLRAEIQNLDTYKNQLVTGRKEIDKRHGELWWWRGVGSFANKAIAHIGAAITTGLYNVKSAGATFGAGLGFSIPTSKAVYAGSFAGIKGLQHLILSDTVLDKWENKELLMDRLGIIDTTQAPVGYQIVEAVTTLADFMMGARAIGGLTKPILHQGSIALGGKIGAMAQKSTLMAPRTVEKIATYMAGTGVNLVNAAVSGAMRGALNTPFRPSLKTRAEFETDEAYQTYYLDASTRFGTVSERLSLAGQQAKRGALLSVITQGATWGVNSPIGMFGQKALSHPIKGYMPRLATNMLLTRAMFRNSPGKQTDFFSNPYINFTEWMDRLGDADDFKGFMSELAGINFNDYADIFQGILDYSYDFYVSLDKTQFRDLLRPINQGIATYRKDMAEVILKYNYERFGSDGINKVIDFLNKTPKGKMDLTVKKKATDVVKSLSKLHGMTESVKQSGVGKVINSTDKGLEKSEYNIHRIPIAKASADEIRNTGLLNFEVLDKSNILSNRLAIGSEKLVSATQAVEKDMVPIGIHKSANSVRLNSKADLVKFTGQRELSEALDKLQNDGIDIVKVKGGVFEGVDNDRTVVLNENKIYIDPPDSKIEIDKLVEGSLFRLSEKERADISRTPLGLFSLEGEEFGIALLERISNPAKYGNQKLYEDIRNAYQSMVGEPLDSMVMQDITAQRLVDNEKSLKDLKRDYDIGMFGEAEFNKMFQQLKSEQNQLSKHLALLANVRGMQQDLPKERTFYTDKSTEVVNLRDLHIDMVNAGLDIVKNPITGGYSKDYVESLKQYVSEASSYVADPKTLNDIKDKFTALMVSDENIVRIVNASLNKQFTSIDEFLMGGNVSVIETMKLNSIVNASIIEIIKSNQVGSGRNRTDVDTFTNQLLSITNDYIRDFSKSSYQRLMTEDLLKKHNLKNLFELYTATKETRNTVFKEIKETYKKETKDTTARLVDKMTETADPDVAATLYKYFNLDQDFLDRTIQQHKFKNPVNEPKYVKGSWVKESNVKMSDALFNIKAKMNDNPSVSGVNFDAVRADLNENFGFNLSEKPNYSIANNIRMQKEIFKRLGRIHIGDEVIVDKAAFAENPKKALMMKFAENNRFLQERIKEGVEVPETFIPRVHDIKTGVLFSSYDMDIFFHKESQRFFKIQHDNYVQDVYRFGTTARRLFIATESENRFKAAALAEKFDDIEKNLSEAIPEKIYNELVKKTNIRVGDQLVNRLIHYNSDIEIDRGLTKYIVRPANQYGYGGLTIKGNEIPQAMIELIKDIKQHTSDMGKFAAASGIAFSPRKNYVPLKASTNSNAPSDVPFLDIKLFGNVIKDAQDFAPTPKDMVGRKADLPVEDRFYEDLPRALNNNDVRLTRKAIFGPVTDRMNNKYQAVPDKSTQDFMTHWVKTAMGYTNEMDVKLASQIGSAVGVEPQIILNLLDIALDLRYASALSSTRISIKNMFQPQLLTAPVTGERNLIKGYANLAKIFYDNNFNFNKVKEQLESFAHIHRLRGGGFSGVYGHKEFNSALLGEGEKVGKTRKGTLAKISKAAFYMFDLSDLSNRFVAYNAAVEKFDSEFRKAGDLTEKNVDKFLTKARADFLGDDERGVARTLLLQNTPESINKVREMLSESIVGATQYLYARTESPLLLTKSKFAKIFGQFKSWGLNYFNLVNHHVEMAHSPQFKGERGIAAAFFLKHVASVMAMHSIAKQAGMNPFDLTSFSSLPFIGDRVSYGADWALSSVQNVIHEALPEGMQGVTERMGWDYPMMGVTPKEFTMSGQSFTDYMPPFAPLFKLGSEAVKALYNTPGYLAVDDTEAMTDKYKRVAMRAADMVMAYTPFGSTVWTPTRELLIKKKYKTNDTIENVYRILGIKEMRVPDRIRMLRAVGFVMSNSDKISYNQLQEEVKSIYKSNTGRSMGDQTFREVYQQFQRLKDNGSLEMAPYEKIKYQNALRNKETRKAFAIRAYERYYKKGITYEQFNKHLSHIQLLEPSINESKVRRWWYEEQANKKITGVK